MTKAKNFNLGAGLVKDIRLRLPYYISDYVDGLRDLSTINKLLSTILLLYFAILMPVIAFGVYFEKSTNKKIGDFIIISTY